MASLVFKKSRGHSYAYWVRSARVNGKPRIVEQVYLGPKQRFLEELKQHFTRGTTPGPTPLKKLRVKEFGASAWLWHTAQQLQLAEIVDRHVPPSRVPTPNLTVSGPVPGHCGHQSCGSGLQ